MGTLTPLQIPSLDLVKRYFAALAILLLPSWGGAKQVRFAIEDN